MAQAFCDQMLYMMQAGGCAWLIYELNRRHPLQSAGAAALADTVTGLLCMAAGRFADGCTCTLHGCIACSPATACSSSSKCSAVSALFRQLGVQ